MNITLDYPSLEDRRLVELHLAGDWAAFRQIVERYQAMVCGLAVSACGDIARSEDLGQEVFIVAWKQLPELREPEKLRAWLCGIARNLIHGSMRRQRRVPTARAETLSPETPADGGSPQDHAISAEESAMMWRALEAMPENYREPMVLFYREHRSVPAVAATLELSEEAVRQRLTRGRAMLSERMAAIVEETLECGGPGGAFTQNVLAALPVTAGAMGAKAGAMSKAALAASGASATAAKSGLGIKLLAGAGALPALISILPGCLDFRMRYDAAKTPEARRSLVRAYVGMHAGVALGMAGTVLWAWVFRGMTREHVGIFVAGLVVVSTLPTLGGFAWGRRQLQRLSLDGSIGDVARVGRTAWEGPGFEYRSERSVLGWPLVHVRTGRKGSGFRNPVKAWFAIGDVAVGRLFAGGGFAVAPVSVGGMTLGLVSSGGIAVGGFALGGMVVGAVALGGMAVGGLAFGGMAVGVMAQGGMALTHLAGGERFHRMAETLMIASGVAWGLAWLPPLVFIGWHCWRRRAVR